MSLHQGFALLEKSRGVIRQVMVPKASKVLLLAPSMSHEHIGQRGLSPEARRNHQMKPDAALGPSLMLHWVFQDRAGAKPTPTLRFGDDALLQATPPAHQQLLTAADVK